MRVLVKKRPATFYGIPFGKVWTATLINEHGAVLAPFMTFEAAIRQADIWVMDAAFTVKEGT